MGSPVRRRPSRAPATTGHASAGTRAAATTTRTRPGSRPRTSARSFASRSICPARSTPRRSICTASRSAARRTTRSSSRRRTGSRSRSTRRAGRFSGAGRRPATPTWPARRRSRRRRRSPIPSRKWIYAASPDGKIQKLSVATGHVAWRRSITMLPSFEKIASSLNVDRRPRHRHDGRLHRRRAAVPGACRRHRRRERPDPARLELALLGPSRASRTRRRARRATPRSGDAPAPSSFPAAGIFSSPRGMRRGTATRNWGDAVLVLSPKAKLIGNYTPTNTAKLNTEDLDLGSTSPVYLTSKLIARGRQGREDPAPLARADPRHQAAQGARAPDRLDAVGHGSLHGARGLAEREAHLADRRRRRRDTGVGAARRTAPLGLARTATVARARSSRAACSMSTT